jgi:hypothetical protein
MSDWKNEDDIKAELRTLTAELRRLREGLSDMVSPPKPNPTRAFLHRQSWAGPVERPIEAADSTRPPATRKSDKSKSKSKNRSR